MRETRPLPALAPYVRGKQNLARRIKERIETIPDGCYAQPFVHMGSVFSKRRTADGSLDPAGAAAELLAALLDENVGPGSGL